MELRLKELAAQGMQGQDIASTLSAEFGEMFTVDSVFHKAGRLGVALSGRASSKVDSEPKDPFAAPRWLMRELAKVEEKKGHERPKKVVVLPTNLEEEITEEMERQRVAEAYQEAWDEYVDDILILKKCSEEQAKRARQNIPAWFREWCEVIIVHMWNGGRVPGLKADLDKFNKAIEEVSELEAEGKTEEELREHIEELEAINKAVSEAQEKEAVRRALKEAEKSS